MRLQQPSQIVNPLARGRRFGFGTGARVAAVVPFVGALDGFTADLTVVVDIFRRLLGSYSGPACRVRADRTGQPEVDISFAADGTLDTAALLSFAGGDSVYLVRPYDQAGALDFTQATAAQQPRLVNAGVLEADGALFDGSNDALSAALADSLDFMGAAAGHVVWRGKVDGASPDGKIFALMDGDNGCSVWLPLAGSYYYHWAYPSARLSGAIPGGVLDTLTDLSFENDANAGVFRVAGSTAASGTEGGTIAGGASSLTIGAEDGGQRFVKCWWSSLVVWKTGVAATCAARNAALGGF